MVRLDSNESSINRQEEFAGDRALRIAGLLCRDPKFWEYLYSDSEISTKDYESATQWLRFYLNLESRSQLKTNVEAQNLLDQLYRKYKAWTPGN
jgi:plasmid maintenance system antidote protein VapI